ncbi:MAG: hypothetical protein POG24_11230, partial [Acidocella sp.]|nr:hypothetical protein [Acidocella sp.]
MKVRLAWLWLLLGLAPNAGHAQASVTQFHATADRAGLYQVPGLTPARLGALAATPSLSVSVRGLLNAQPLYWQPPDGRNGLIITASEANQVVALDARTGRMVWQRTLGPPASRAGQCGNIDPVGVTATPVIEAASGAIYLDAVIDRQGQQTQEIFGLKLGTGANLPGFPLRVRTGLGRLGIGFTDRLQESRSALSLFDGRLYVAFGGYDGDCG